MSLRKHSFGGAESEEPEAELEYRVQEIGELGSGAGRSVSRFIREWQASSTSLVGKALKSHVILPDSHWYYWWTYFIIVSAAYSSFFTPMEFGFYRGLPKRISLFDMAVQVIFLVDIVINFFVAYNDKHTYKMVTSQSSIAFRYAKTDLFPDVIACLPWDAIYKAAGRNEAIRYLLWVRLYRVRKVQYFFQRLEKDIRVNYFVARIAKLLTVEFYCTHTAACIFYYLATTMPHSKEPYTWIGSLTLGDYSYKNFHSIDLSKRYITALYWAILTMATVGYGDVHAVNTREMLFVMVYVSFDMILGAYLIGNMTALIVKGSGTEKFRDKMGGIIKFMNMHHLPKDLRQQMKNHVKLEFEGQLTERMVMKDFPASIRAKVSQALYRKTVAAVPLFKNCSNEFINQIVSRVRREYFLPGEIIMEQGTAADRVYIVYHGLLEEVSVAEDGSEEVITVEDQSIFGEVAILCNIPQPYTVRVCELSTLLRIDKQAFTNIMQIYAVDSRQVLNNLLEQQSTDFRIRQLADDIQAQLANQQSELALRMNNAAHQGNLYYLRSLIRAGADPAKADYAGRTPLHLAASKGYEDLVQLLLREGANINAIDHFGNTPLLEAIKGGHDYTAAILVEKGASLMLMDPGSTLCTAVINGNLEFLKRLISQGVDPNSADYDLRTPLHIAAAEGLHLFVKLLINAGANVFAKDRWGHTPFDEAKRCGSVLVISAFEAAFEKPSSDSGDVERHESSHASSNSTSSNSPRELRNHPDAEVTLHADMKQPLRSLSLQRHSSSRGHARHSTSRELARLSTSRELGRLSSSLREGQCIIDFEQSAGPMEQQPQLKDHSPQVVQRCTLIPDHPFMPSARQKHGTVVSVPSSVQELLQLASEHFGGLRTCVLNEHGEEITKLERLKSSERIYVVEDEAKSTVLEYTSSQASM